MDYIDFIDSPTIRDHLRTQAPLPPAQQCILIAQSSICPLTEKLAALREIRAATASEEFSRGCWKYQSEDSFPVILDRYLQVREARLALLEKAAPGVVYVVETNYRDCYGAPYSTFAAALVSVEPLEDDECPPRIRRRRIDDADGATLVAELSRRLEVVEIDEEGGDAGSRDWSGDLPNGYAYVPHPFKRGDIIRQRDSYYVLDESVEENDGRFSWGTDESDMVLYGMSWDKPSGSFGHEHIYYTQGETELVAPADLPEQQRMLAAVSEVMRDGHALIEFLQCFTCGGRDNLEKYAVKCVEREKPPQESTSPRLIRRSDLPGLPANLWLFTRNYFGIPTYFRIQRDGSEEPHFRDSVELTLEAEPKFLGGTGDLSPDDVNSVRAFVVRNLDLLLAYWNEKMSFDDLLATLRRTIFGVESENRDAIRGIRLSGKQQGDAARLL